MLKRKLAALLAGAMILTSLPMVSFAASDNRITKVPIVADDHKFNEADAPKLLIKPKDNDWGNPIQSQIIRLKFENAKWRSDGDGTTTGGIAYRKLTDTMVEFKLTGDSPIPLYTEVTGAGDVKVTIDPLDSEVSAGTYTFAIAGDGATKAWIDDVKEFADTVTLDELLIEELKVGSFVPDKVYRKIVLTLPAEFEWVDVNNYTLDFAGGYTGTIANDVSKVDDVDADGEYFFTTATNDKEELEVYVNVPSVNKRGTLVLKNLKIRATNKADMGDVAVAISGNDVTKESLVVAKYVDYGVIVKAEDKDLPELLAGEDEGTKHDDHKLLEVTIEEKIVDSWWTNRRTVFTFPEGIKIRDVEIDEDKTNLTDGDIVTNGVLVNNTYFSLNDDLNELTMEDVTIPGATDKGKIKFKFWVSVQADFVGDIVVNVGGPSLPEDTELTLGKVLAPVDVDVDVQDLQVGYKSVDGGKIVITEAKAGALKKGEKLELALETIYFDEDVKPTVTTEGEIKVGTVKFDKDNNLTIEITRESKKEAGSIVIEGLKVDLGRALAKGAYDLRVGGNAIVRNNDVDGNGDPVKPYEFAEEDFVVETPYINIVTPAPHEGEATGAAVKTSFTVGSTEYTVGDETATADAAPYVKDGRTMLPVKYVAYALGVSPQNIKWDQATKTVTILGDRVIQVKIGSKDLLVNGAVLTMDTAAEVTDGRTFLPISWVASALNVPYSWDDATKTVTFN